MNEQNIIASHADHESANSKLFGLPRPFAGALIGVLIFLLILLPLKFLNYNSPFLYLLALNLEVPGRMTIVIVGMIAGIDLSESFLTSLSLTISAIPAGIAGGLIGSPKNSTRITGMFFSLLYLGFILAFGSVLALLGI